VPKTSSTSRHATARSAWSGRDVDGGLHDVLRSTAGGVERDKEIVNGLARLRRDIALTDYVSVRIEGTGSRCEDRDAGRGDRNIGVRDAGVERGGVDLLSRLAAVSHSTRRVLPGWLALDVIKSR